MVEFFELVASYWKKSKEDWDQNRHRLYTLFAFVLVAYLVLELGSYIFTSRLEKTRTVDAIRTKFLDNRVILADEFIRKFFLLKETTRELINNLNKSQTTALTCEKLLKNYRVSQVETDLFVSSANLRYFFGDIIANEFVAFIKWFDVNNNNCFKDVPHAEDAVDKKIHSIREKMWAKMYPPDIIEGIR